MKKFNLTMFDSIKDALASSESSGSSANNILRFEKNKVYTVRLLPNIQNPAESFYHYFTVGWDSFATGQYVYAVSPSSVGERDPILEARFKLYKQGSEEDKKKITNVKRAEKWLANVYVVDDPVNPENNGTNMIIRYGKQLDKIIRRAIDGEDADEFGARVFDLSSDGCNFKIDIEDQGGYATYVSSRFIGAGKANNLNLNENQIEDIYSNVFDLKNVFSIKSFAELEKMFKEHYLCDTSEDSDEEERHNKHNVPPARNNQHVQSNSNTDDDEPDPTVKALLAGIDDDD